MYSDSSSGKSVLKVTDDDLEISKEKLFQRQIKFQEQMWEIQMRKGKLQKFRDVLNKRYEQLAGYKYDNDVTIKRERLKSADDIRGQQLKEKELKKIESVTAALHNRKIELTDVIERLEKYNTFILKVISMLPTDYVKSKEDSLIEGFMSRFQSLLQVNEILFIEMMKSNDKIKYWKEMIDSLLMVKRTTMLELSIKYMRILSDRETLASFCCSKAFGYFEYFSNIRKDVYALEKILLSVDNITNKCIFQFKNFEHCEIVFTKTPFIKSMRVDEKVYKIFEYIKYYCQTISAVTETEPLQNQELSVFLNTNLQYKF